MTESDVSKMKVVDLKHGPKLTVSPITRNNTELEERLQKEENKTKLSLAKNELLEKPTNELNTDVPRDIPNEAIVPKAMKIALKRKSSALSTESSATVPNTVVGVAVVNEIGSESPNRKAKILKLDEKPEEVIAVSHAELEVKPTNVINMPTLRSEERLQVRAKKFDLDENKVSNIKVNSISSGTKDINQKQKTLKKRAERFGSVVSSTIAKITAHEKLQRRMQRFERMCRDIYAERARLRLERFKTITK